MLKLQEFILNHPKDWEILLKHNPYNLTIKHDGKLIIFNYQLFNTDFHEPLVSECRGIILEEGTWRVVCRGFDKFWNYGEELAAKIDWNTTRVQTKVDGCFSGEDFVLMSDGGKKKLKTIYRLAKKGIPLSVLSYDFKNRTIEPKQITNVIRKECDSKTNWLTIKIGGVKQALTATSLSRRCVMTVTDNHIIYIKNNNGQIEEIEAGSLKKGDRVFTTNYSLTSIQKQVILGSLLGDGSCTFCKKDTGNKGLSFGHSLKQKDYALFKQSLLSSIGGKLEKRIVKNSYGKEKVRYTTNVHAGITAIHHLIYNSQNERTLSIEAIRQLNWLGFAIWYMDDGSRQQGNKMNSIHLHTEGYKQEEVQQVVDYYNSIGLKCYMQNPRKYYIINFSVESSDYIWENIRKYIIPSMQYKLPERHRGFFEDITAAEIPQLCLYEGVVLEINNGRLAHNPDEHSVKYKYDLEIKDNHNYFCQGVLVHNSILKVYYYDTAWRVATNGMINAFDVKAVSAHPENNTLVKNFGQLFTECAQAQGLDYSLLDKNNTYIFELTTSYNEQVIKYDKPAIWHIGTRSNITGQEFNVDIKIQKPQEWKFQTLDDVISVASKFKEEQEGFVAVDANYKRIKIKSPYYVAASHYFNDSLALSKLIGIFLSGDYGEFLAYYPKYGKIIHEMEDFVAKRVKDVEDKVKYWQNIVKSGQILPTKLDFYLQTKDEYAGGYLSKFYDYLVGKRTEIMSPKEYVMTDIHLQRDIKLHLRENGVKEDVEIL